jgi:hypothetical protein
LSRILVPSAGPESWQTLLAKPDLHWARGRSARTMAHSWETHGGCPPEVVNILAQAFGPGEPLLIAPEWKTALPHGERASQTDVFVLHRHAKGTAAVAVEGKVDEPFGPTIAIKRGSDSSQQIARLDWLLTRLGISDCPGDVHYQLLHRTAAALIEAERFGATGAAMIVHSFSPTMRWFDAFARFAGVLGADVEPGRTAQVNVPGTIPLWLGWACGDQQFRVA